MGQFRGWRRVQTVSGGNGVRNRGFLLHGVKQLVFWQICLS